MSSWVTDAAGLFDERSRSLAFRFVLASAGVLGIGADITRWSRRRAGGGGDVGGPLQGGPRRDHRWRGAPDRRARTQPRCAVQYTLGDRVVVLAWNAGGLDGLDRVPARDIRLPLRGPRPGRPLPGTATPSSPAAT